MNPGSPPRALIVDDEALICQLLGDMLRWLGMEAETSTDPQEAVAWLEGDRRYDLLVTDLVMPRMTGWTLIEIARTRRPHLGVLIITGMATPSVIRRAGKARLVLLRKPFTMAEFEAAVRDALAPRSPAPIREVC